MKSYGLKTNLVMKSRTAILKEMNYVNVCISRCIALGNQHDLIQYVSQKEKLQKELEGRLKYGV